MYTKVKSSYNLNFNNANIQNIFYNYFYGFSLFLTLYDRMYLIKLSKVDLHIMFLFNN